VAVASLPNSRWLPGTSSPASGWLVGRFWRVLAAAESGLTGGGSCSTVASAVPSCTAELSVAEKIAPGATTGGRGNMRTSAAGESGGAQNREEYGGAACHRVAR
jgi:hypothetical protein